MEDKKNGKGKGKGLAAWRPDPFDEIAHQNVPGNTAGNKYYSFWYGAIDQWTFEGIYNGKGGLKAGPLRTVLEVDGTDTPTNRYWVVEHPGNGDNNYVNWSGPGLLP